VSTANINTKVKNSLNSLIMESTDSNSLSSLVSSINDKITGVANEVDDKIGTAVSTLFSENEDVKASIATIVNENTTLIKAIADKFTFDGQRGKMTLTGSVFQVNSNTGNSSISANYGVFDKSIQTNSII